MRHGTAILGLVFMAGLAGANPGRDTKSDAIEALKKATTFAKEKIANQGGFVYYYSEDLSQRWGEGKLDMNTIEVQPPGTPTWCMAFIRAYEATKDKVHLDAAKAAATALVKGQLVSGGWDHTISFSGGGKKGGRMGKYRKGPAGGSWNTSSLDDGQTSSALMAVIKVDHLLDKKDADIHDAAMYGLDAFIKAQFSNGAFPQCWTGPQTTKAADKAKYPEYEWRTENRPKEYWFLPTLNDSVGGYAAETLMLAFQVYKDGKYKDALKKLGDFLINYQMPDPQPAWAQQYTLEGCPSWARKFEPPAITSWESQDVMETLMKISAITGDKKYLEPIPKCIKYLKDSLLPDGRLARYYELKSNKPLYMDGKYQLTYDDSKAPSHYGWKQNSRLDQIEKWYTMFKNGDKAALADLDNALAAKEGVIIPPAAELEAAAQKIVKELDADGKWVTAHDGRGLVGQPKFASGFKYIGGNIYASNYEILASYIESKK